MTAVATLASIVALLPLGQATATFSVRCAGRGRADCALLPGDVEGAQATGSFHDGVEEDGWGRLLVRTETTDGFAAFAAGYLEGALTSRRIMHHYTNLIAGNRWHPLPPGSQAYIEATDAWARSQITQADRSDEYWTAVRFMHDQLDGLLEGVNSQLTSERHLTRLDVLLINMHADMLDIAPAVNTTTRLDFETVATSDLSLWIQKRSHCSSLVKLTPDHQELFVGHNTWIGFHLMIRMFKRYEFGSRRAIAMSSFPGVLASTDDFYTIGNELVVTETTLPQYTNDIYGAITPESLPCWLRAMVANLLATSGEDWMQIFSKHNSGTYNNMWMVVDYSRFTPGELLPRGVLTVGEQLPGYFHFEDQTHILSYGYWPSYNVALYPGTVERIHQVQAVKRHGKQFSYQLAPRAQILLRDQAQVLSDAEMQRVMRRNQFQTDPLAVGDSCNQMACRADLAEGAKRQAFGAIDAKYTSRAHVLAGRTVVVAGPTHDDQPVFDWSAAGDLAKHTSHVGHPNRFDFEWLVMLPNGDATSWHQFIGSDPLTETQLMISDFLIPTLIAVSVGLTVFALTLCKVRGPSDSLDLYKPLDVSSSRVIPGFF